MDGLDLSPPTLSTIRLWKGWGTRRQALVCHDVAGQIAGGDKRILGVMIESNLVAGAQPLGHGARLDSLVYGQSITDACIDWKETWGLLEELAGAVRARRG
jgi:3-deoxy-7-phosphoheptulonate synthase